MKNCIVSLTFVIMQVAKVPAICRTLEKQCIQEFLWFIEKKNIHNTKLCFIMLLISVGVICLSVRLSVCLPACLPACLLACLSVCLSVCRLSVWFDLMLHTHCHQVSSLRSVIQITQFLGNYQYLVHISFKK